MSGEELKPCPFCGATDGRLVQAFTRATDNFAFWSVECLDCGVEVADDESQANADRAWNRRHPLPEQPQEGEQPLCQKVPDRIFLADLGDGDISWCDDPDPSGENEVAVEYARVGVWRKPVEDDATETKESGE